MSLSLCARVFARRLVAHSGRRLSPSIASVFTWQSSSVTTVIHRRYYSQEAHASNVITEKHEFQAETRKLLDIVAKSLYSEQEVFIRELISNASDALEKRRYIQLTTSTIDDQQHQHDHPLEISIDVDEKSRMFTIRDSGIGMNKQELIDCLGTIARSGSREFVSKLSNDTATSDSIIGQFGVGFYSVFMVADSVEVTTRQVGSRAYVWKSDGSGTYEISEADDDTPIGTTIRLHLKSGDAAEFAKQSKVTEVVNKYSYFVTAPILVNGTRINSLNAIWTLDKKDISDDMHMQFYKHISRDFGQTDTDARPQYTIQYKTDSPLNIRALLYVPTRRYSPVEFASDQDVQVALYARRVLIKRSAKELMPRYLRFMVGVVDSEDIPLNLSREMLQKNQIISKLQRVLAERVVNFFVTEMGKDRVKYNEFYRNYSLFFKEGILLENDQQIKEKIAQLLMFESSNHKAGTTTSLAEYVGRMQIDQKHIYYLFAPSRQLAESSPYFEAFKSRNYEVLFLYDPADELVFLALPQFEMKQLQSVEKWMQSNDTESVVDPKLSSIETMRDSDKKDMLTWLKQTLGSVKVDSIQAINRPSSEYPVVIVVDNSSAARHLLRIGDIKDMEHLVMLKPTLQVNISHPLIKGLIKLRKTDKELAESIAEQMYDNALVIAGLLKDSSRMVQRMNRLLTSLIDTNRSGSTILTP